MMRVLVTGAGGFAGTNIVKYFSQAGYEVVGTYRSTRPSLDDVCRLEYCELSRPIEIDGDFDAIVHTACAPFGDFARCKRDNIDSMEQLIAFARKKKVKTLINFSTRSIYGGG